MVTLSAMGLSGQLFWGLSSRWPECKCRVRAAWSRGGGWYFPQLMRIPVSQLDTQQPWERLRDKTLSILLKSQPVRADGVLK